MHHPAVGHDYHSSAFDYLVLSFDTAVKTLGRNRQTGEVLLRSLPMITWRGLTAMGRLHEGRSPDMTGSWVDHLMEGVEDTPLPGAAPEPEPALPLVLAPEPEPALKLVTVGDAPAELRAARRARGLTQQETADLLGCGCSTYGHWETGRAPPWPKKHAAIAEHLGLKIVLGPHRYQSIASQ